MVRARSSQPRPLGAIVQRLEAETAATLATAWLKHQARRGARSAPAGGNGPPPRRPARRSPPTLFIGFKF